MKKIKIIPIQVFLPLTVLAQNTKQNRIEKNKQSPQILLLSQMDQRKIYHWENGKWATVNGYGREAGEAPTTYLKVHGRLGNRAERSN